MSIARAKYAYRAAFEAFYAAWVNYDEFETKRLEIEKEMTRRQEAFNAGTKHFDDGEKHFINSFINNLEPGARPDRERAARFVSLLETCEVPVAVDIAKCAVAKCPLLATVPVFGKWARQHLAKLKTVTPEVTA